MEVSLEQRGARMARVWLKIAVLYLLAGSTFGLIMGLTHQFQFAPVHAHANLLGWASLALAGLIYWLCPQAGVIGWGWRIFGCTISACRYF